MTSIEWGDGLALRYGGFYGPGTGISLAPDAAMAAPVRKRQFLIIGDGGSVFSHIHIDDAAAATVRSGRARRGDYQQHRRRRPAPVRDAYRCWRARSARATKAYPALAGAAARPARWQRS